MAPPKDLAHINKTNAYSYHVNLDYFYKIHQMLTAQHLMQREILIRLGSPPVEVDQLIQLMQEEAEKSAQQDEHNSKVDCSQSSRSR